MNFKINHRALALPFLSIIVLWVYAFYTHNVFEEWDGVMHYYSGSHLADTGKYEGWASHFWPPLQPLLLSLGPPLLVGKLIAVLGGLLTLFSVNSILVHFRVNSHCRAVTIVFLMSLPFFIKAFSVVENHALETGLYLLSISYYLKFTKNNKLSNLLLCAAVCALAGLTRYTSFTLALIIGSFLLIHSPKKIKNFLIFSVMFLIVSSFWWVQNYSLNGSPLATWQYLNVGSSIATMDRFEWWWKGQELHNSMGSVIQTYPAEFAVNLFKNLIIGIILTFSSLSFLQNKLAIIPLLLIAYLVFKQRNSLKNADMMFIIFCAFSYILLCSMAFVFFDALLPSVVLLVVFSSIIASKYVANKYFNIAIYSLTILNLISSIFYTNAYLEDQRTNDELYEYAAIAKVIKKDSQGTEATVMSIHPAHGFYTEQDWIMTPLASVNNLCEVLDYKVSDKVFSYAPKSNFSLKRENLFINYLIVTKELKNKWPFINEQLQNISSNTCSSRLQEIYRSPKAVVYKQIALLPNLAHDT